MKLHANAQTCPHCRSLIVSRVMGGQMPVSVAQDFRVSIKTVLKWVARFRVDGAAGLEDRSSRPHRIARLNQQPSKELSDAVFALLHTPPLDSGFNRTTWRLTDLKTALQTRGVSTSQSNIHCVIKQAGYWRPLLLLFAHMNEKGLIRQGFELRYLVAEKIEHVVPMLRAAERKIALGPLLSVHFSPKISATYSQLTRLSMTAFR
jgi:transposase